MPAPKLKYILKSTASYTVVHWSIELLAQRWEPARRKVSKTLLDWIILRRISVPQRNSLVIELDDARNLDNLAPDQQRSKFLQDLGCRVAFGTMTRLPRAAAAEGSAPSPHAPHQLQNVEAR